MFSSDTSQNLIFLLKCPFICIMALGYTPLCKLKVRESSSLLFQIYFTVVSFCYFCLLNFPKIGSSHFHVFNSGLHNFSPGLFQFSNWSCCLDSQLFPYPIRLPHCVKVIFLIIYLQHKCMHAHTHTQLKSFPAFKSSIESDFNVFAYYIRLFITWLLPNIPAFFTFPSPFYVPAILYHLKSLKYHCPFLPSLECLFFPPNLMVSYYLSSSTLKYYPLQEASSWVLQTESSTSFMFPEHPVHCFLW